MRQETQQALQALLLLSIAPLPILLVLQRPAERLGDTVHRYRVLLGLYLGIGFMTMYGGWVVLAYAAIALAALVGIGFIAEAVHKQHLRHEAGRQATGR